MVPNRWTDFDKPLLLFGYQRDCELQSCSQRWRSVGIGSRRVSSTRTTPRSAEKGFLESPLVWRFLRRLTCLDIYDLRAAAGSVSCVWSPPPTRANGVQLSRLSETPTVRNWPLSASAFGRLTRVGCIDRGEFHPARTRIGEGTEVSLEAS
jgi:hypothetical protein